ncbi:hypothetical protein SESBI_02589 [Sesbania bispinosa]|nr:hypothetical protein SESBI_02589 [Sesbania bispinosa]
MTTITVCYTKSGDYASTFTYMDRIFGTDEGYRKLKALKNTRVEESSEKKKQLEQITGNIRIDLKLTK